MELGDRILCHHDKLPSACFGIFRSMKQKGELCDFVIKFGNYSISAHRLVLAAAIPYFRNMFGNASYESCVREVTMAAIDPHAMESLVDFAYSSHIEITEDNAKTLLSTSCTVGIDKVRDACCDFLGSRLTPQNVLPSLQLAERLSCLGLVGRSYAYVCENFDEVAHTEEFLNAPSCFIKCLLMRDDLKTSSEENVFQTVMNWVKQSPLDRRDELPELLRSVRLALIAPDYIMDRVVTEEFIRTSIPCRDLLDQVKFYHFFPHRRSELPTTLERHPRCCEESNSSRSGNTVLGLYMAYTTVHLQYFDTENGDWRDMAAATVSQQHNLVSAGSNKLYFLDSDYLISCTLRNGKWGIGKTCFVGRTGTGVAIIGNKLYICGGGGYNPLNAVQYFDTETRTLEDDTPMLEARSSLGVVALEGCLYAIGGFDKERNASDVAERFDPERKVWNSIVPMLTKRYGMGCATVGWKIYVCGGQSFTKRLSSAEVYDPLADQWKFISNMKSARSLCSVTQYGGKLFAVGGCDSPFEHLYSMEIYDPETGEWKPVPPTR